MRSWIRNHRLAAVSWAVLALTGIAGVLLFCYFNYCFTLRWADASGQMDSHRREAIAGRSLRVGAQPHAATAAFSDSEHLLPWAGAGIAFSLEQKAG